MTAISSLFELLDILEHWQRLQEFLATPESWKTIFWLILILIPLILARKIGKWWKELALRLCPNVLSKGSFEQFDTPIRKAIWHLIETSPHSYTGSSLAEREAFKNLYEAMCKGSLPVIGKESDFKRPRHISWWECRKLKPREGGVTVTDAAPDGVTFLLIRFKTEEGHKKIEQRLCDLRVRSSDLYNLWPKV